MAATAGATGVRSWLGVKRFSWLTPTRLRLVTIALIAAALLASATLVSGSSTNRPDARTTPAAAQAR